VEYAADAVLVAAWLAVVSHNAYLIALGISRAAETRRAIAGLALACVLVVAGIQLERASGGRLFAPTMMVIAGLFVACAGAALHVRVRQTFGTAWSSRPGGAAVLIEDGAYGLVRHPLYLGLVMLAFGTILAHPSLPTIAGGIGLCAGIAGKIRLEERALASNFGGRWDAYRNAVPCLLPRIPTNVMGHGR
jgi:protein-S-isoprenylcysteine O-methyltransferase Ste14